MRTGTIRPGSEPWDERTWGHVNPSPTLAAGDSVLSFLSSELFTLNRLAGEMVEDKRAEVRSAPEVEHVQQAACELIERTLAGRGAGRMIKIIDAAELPIVLEKANDGGLVGGRVIDKVALCPRRNYKKGQTRAVAAAAEIGSWSRYPAIDSTVQHVRARRVGAIHNRSIDVIVPAISVVVGNDNDRVFPFRGILKVIDGVDHEELLRERVRIRRARVSIHGFCGFEE